MRPAFISAGLVALMVAVAGCNNWPHWRRDQDQVKQFDQRSPTAEQLVAYLNRNAQKVQGLECRKAFIDATQGSQSVGMDATILCQRPRDFRLVGEVVGHPEVDMGSNSQEFWYWVKRAEPSYVYHCSYDDFRRGVRMPFPFQPEWVMEALGVATYDETKRYQVRETQNSIELIDQATSPQGQPVRKVIVFGRGPASTGKPQVTAYLLQDAAGKEIASAYVSEVQLDQASGATVPRKVRLVWPAEKVEMKITLNNIRVGGFEPQRAAGVFSRRNLANLPSYDLARGPDSPAGAGQPQPLQRVGGPR